MTESCCSCLFLYSERAGLGFSDELMVKGHGAPGENKNSFRCRRYVSRIVSSVVTVVRSGLAQGTSSATQGRYRRRVAWLILNLARTSHMANTDFDVSSPELSLQNTHTKHALLAIFGELFRILARSSYVFSSVDGASHSRRFCSAAHRSGVVRRTHDLVLLKQSLPTSCPRQG